MNLTNSKVQQAVWHFARWITQRVPSIQYEDAAQDLWIDVLEASAKYKDSSEASFSTFVFKHLHWRAMDLIKHEIRRCKRDTAFAAKTVDFCLQEEQSVESLAAIVHKQLSNFDGKVLEILMSPPLELTSDQKSSDHLTSWMLASYLKVPKKTIDYSRAKIRKAIRKVLDE
jgi:DNA-directed RNA polymerase specialized sigma24 family protein